MMKSQKKSYLNMTALLLLFFLFTPHSTFFRSLHPLKLIFILDSLRPHKLQMKMLNLSKMMLFLLLLLQKTHTKVNKILLLETFHMMMTRAKKMITSLKVPLRTPDPSAKILWICLPCWNLKITLLQQTPRLIRSFSK